MVPCTSAKYVCVHMNGSKIKPYKLRRCAEKFAKRMGWAMYSVESLYMASNLYAKGGKLIPYKDIRLVPSIYCPKGMVYLIDTNVINGLLEYVHSTRSG